MRVISCQYFFSILVFVCVLIVYGSEIKIYVCTYTWYKHDNTVPVGCATDRECMQECLSIEDRPPRMCEFSYARLNFLLL